MSPENIALRNTLFIMMAMNIIMKNMQIKTVEEMGKFLEGNEQVDFEIASREDKYTLISDTLICTKYNHLRKKKKES